MDFKDEELKPRRWLLVILVILAIVISTLLINKLVINHKNKDNKKTWGIFEIFKTDTKDSYKVKSFNNKLEIYKGNKFGSSLSSLLDEIVTINKKEDHKIVVIFEEKEFTDPTEIKNIKNDLDTWDNYDVSFDYDEDGYINKVEIDTSNIQDSFSKISFNSAIEFHKGKQYGSEICDLIDTIITNNKKNKKHILVIVYKKTKTSDVEELKTLKKQFAEWTKYEVSIDYDEKGYASEITIEN